MSDLAEMRGATSRADVGSVAARLQAEAATLAPVFPPQLEPLSKVGYAQRHGNGWRAYMKVNRGEQHRGPQRDTEAEAVSDLAEMRGATCRADVGSVAARLQAEAAAHREHRERAGDRGQYQ